MMLLLLLRQLQIELPKAGWPMGLIGPRRPLNMTSEVTVPSQWYRYNSTSREDTPALS